MPDPTASSRPLPTIPPGRPFTFDRVIRLLLSVAALLAAVWLIDLLKPVLLPFLVAWLGAYILEPFVQYNRRLFRVRNRWLPVFATLLEAVFLFWGLCLFLAPSIIDEAHQLAAFVSRYADAGSDIPFIPGEIHEFLRQTIDFNTISQQLTTDDYRSILDAVGSFLAGGVDLVLGIFNWFIVLLYLVFIMLDYERLIRGSRRMVPPKYREIVFRIGGDVKRSMNHYFRGQGLIATIVGVLFCIGFMIVGLPMAIVMGLFIGLLNMVPYLQLISLIPVTLLCLVSSTDTGVDFWTLWWECMAVYIVVQLTQDLILTPRIMGKAMGLNPALILLSLSVWGTLLGFIGLIIALPLTTLLLSYYETYIATREEARGAEEISRGV